MKIWVDDVRPMPDGFDFWAKTYQEAIEIIQTWKLNNWIIDAVSLDNDLGEDSLEGRKIVLWFAENDYWPREVAVHSANVVAHEYMLGMISRYKPVE